jgi:hypothetical protein
MLVQDMLDTVSNQPAMTRPDLQGAALVHAAADGVIDAIELPLEGIDIC